MFVLLGWRRCGLRRRGVVMMRRTALVVDSFRLVAAATVSPALAPPTASAPSDVAADFNNDGVADNDGFADLAAGAPSEKVDSTAAASAVSVLPGSARGADTPPTGIASLRRWSRTERSSSSYGREEFAGDSPSARNIARPTASMAMSSPRPHVLPEGWRPRRHDDRHQSPPKGGASGRTHPT